MPGKRTYTNSQLASYKKPKGHKAPARFAYAIKGDKIKVLFKYDPMVVKAIHRLSGRSFHRTSKQCWWEAERTTINLEILVHLKFVLSDKLEQWYQDTTNHPTKAYQESKPLKEWPSITNVPGLRKKLRPYQEDGVGFLEAVNGQALLGDEMGLDKTEQALAYLQLHLNLRPAVIIAPAVVKINWARECSLWLDKPRVEILEGFTPYDIPKQDIIVVNYTILQYWVKKLLSLKPNIVIVDECHFCGNPKAKRTKAVIKLSRNVQHTIALSGTPIANRPINFFTVLRLINPRMFDSYFEYAQRYCDAKWNGFAMDYSGASNLKELYTRINRVIMIRRHKKDVLKELPPKVRTLICIEIDNRKEYTLAEQNFTEWLGKKEEDEEKVNKVQALAKLEALKQLTIAGKMKQCFEWIDNFLESGLKLIVICVHTKTINELMARYKNKAIRLDGSVSGQKRMDLVDKFQEDPKTQLAVGQIKVLVGINLTAAHNVCVIEYAWQPTDHDQSEDRVHRIGQTADKVNIWYLVADNTIENRIIKLLDDKRKVLHEALDGELKLERHSLLNELLLDYRSKTNGVHSV